MTTQSTAKATMKTPKTIAKADASTATTLRGPRGAALRGSSTTRIAPRFVTRAEKTSSMSATTLTCSDDLVVALRGTLALRPSVDRGLAGGLRAWLDDGIFELLGAPAIGAVRVRTSDVAGTPPTGGLTAMLRGALVAQLLSLHVAGCTPADAYAAAATALHASGRDNDLAEALDELDTEERARLAAEVASHGAVLVDRLPAVPARWSPRVGVRHHVALSGGGVILRGRIDLTLGEPGGTTACVCLLDVTTSPLEQRHEDALSYLALLETLRSGEPPLRVAALSTADGTALVRDVTGTLLADAADAVLGAIREQGAP